MTLKRIILFLILAAGGSFAVLTWYPDVFFGSVLNSRYISVHTAAPLDISAGDMLGRVSDKLAADDFFDPGQKLELYLGDSYGKYSLLTPFCAKAPACVHPLTGKVFVAMAEPGKNLAYGPEEPPKARSLEGLVAHELVKAQLLNKIGPLKYLSLHEWQTDGYAEHVAMEAGDADPSIICPGNEPRDPRAQYLQDRLVLDAVKQENDTSYPLLMDNNRSGDEALRHVMQRYCSKSN